MKSLAFLLLASSLAFTTTACGGDDDDDGATDALPIDSNTGIDARPIDGGGNPDALIDGTPDSAPAARVVEVTCPATPDKTINTGPGNVWNPTTTTIAANQTVKFVIGPSHNLHPQAPTTDAALNSSGAGTKCFQFTAADTYHYTCTNHPGMNGTVVVN